jgi:hypothetical protein
MLIKRIGGCIVCMMLLFMSACVLQQEDTMTHKAKIQVDPTKYTLFLKNLDFEMAKLALIRTGAAVPFNERKGRDDLFGVYHTKSTDNWWFLSVSDIGETGVILMYVYANTLKNETIKNKALENVNTFLSLYGTKLQPTKVTVTSNKAN